MFYRASYHLAAVTSLAVIVSLTFRQASPLALTIVPLVGWARYRLEQHTPGQLVTGFGLAVAVSLALYWLGLSESFVI
jgi:membrane-associated phospholipid phosphatase